MRVCECAGEDCRLTSNFRTFTGNGRRLAKAGAGIAVTGGIPIHSEKLSLN